MYISQEKILFLDGTNQRDRSLRNKRNKYGISKKEEKEMVDFFQPVKKLVLAEPKQIE